MQTTLKHFRSSPLWLIGLFVIFAEGISAIAAIQLSGWPQQALVVFVIAYASLVTLAFFCFLWWKPENFYSPADYTQTTPQDFVRAIRRLPSEVKSDVNNFSSNPGDKVTLFKLLNNLLREEVKQHIVLMARNRTSIETSKFNEHGHTHNYEFLLRNGSVSAGIFDPRAFLKSLDGTDMVIVRGDQRTISLLPEGEEFASWLIQHGLDAESFQSEQGCWGEPFSLVEMFKKKAELLKKDA
jgi:hypothetical protein